MMMASSTFPVRAAGVPSSPQVDSKELYNRPKREPAVQKPASGTKRPPTFNGTLQPQSVFGQNFNVSASGHDPVNSYLAIYLSALIYPEFLDQLTGSPFIQNEGYTKTLHTNPIAFVNAFIQDTANLNFFTAPSYKWFFGEQGGYDPEAMVITTTNAVFVVFRGTDRVGAEKTLTGYQWAEWFASDFYAIHDTPDLPTLTGKVHKGFWDSLKAPPRVVRQTPGGAAYGQCLGSSRNEVSFRECLVSEIRADAGATKKVFLIGHSLGAVQAQAFAAYLAGHVDARLQSDAIKPQGIYAIASPHLGDDVFRDRINNLLGRNRLQRFDFVNDPVTMLPPYVLGPFQYGRAGTRIYYDDVQTVEVAVPERFPGTSSIEASFIAGVLTGGVSALFSVPTIGSDFCFHYPQWYLNAAWSAVPGPAKSQLPEPLPLPRAGGRDPQIYGGCMNPVTVARGERSGAGVVADTATATVQLAQETAAAIGEAIEQVVYDAGQLFTNLLTNPVEDGDYTLRLLQGRKYLDVSGSCVGQNGCKVQLWDIGKSVSNNRFFIRKEIGGYSIRNGSGDNPDFLEVDANELLKNHGRVQMWEANLPLGGHNGNQLWHFYPIPNKAGHYLIRNVVSGKVLGAKKDCVNQNGCNVRQANVVNNDASQVWILSRIQ